MKNIAQKEARKQPKIKTEMSGKGLTVHAGLLPVLTFIGKLMFRERIQVRCTGNYEKVIKKVMENVC